MPGGCSRLTEAGNVYFLTQVVEVITSRSNYRGQIPSLNSNLDVGRSSRFLPQQFGTVYRKDNSQYYMHLRSRLLSRPSISSSLDNRVHPMANTSQPPDLEGIHLEMYGIVEQIRIMNEINARQVQHLATNSSPPSTAPFWKMLIKLAILTDRSTGTHRIAVVLVKDIQPGNREGYLVGMTKFTRYLDEVMCKVFSTTLKGPARPWFRKLSSRTIDSFGNLSKLFVAYLMGYMVRQKNVSRLCIIHQKDGESLKWRITSDRTIKLGFLKSSPLPPPVITSPMSHWLIKLTANLHLAIHSEDEVTKLGSYWLEDMKGEGVTSPLEC
ncbi:hypothetical protein Acr_07g0010420 [Actinidia rufa]|uniref:Uncharacterized protein n=1 Tax=Actinidia rufa TaxID=165716 RepID=A0A7J0EWK4_9ERIC|nr:hypothetical protein Acr_07g0010420 [Actinidia rufa]